MKKSFGYSRFEMGVFIVFVATFVVVNALYFYSHRPAPVDAIQALGSCEKNLLERQIGYNREAVILKWEIKAATSSCEHAAEARETARANTVKHAEQEKALGFDPDKDQSNAAPLQSVM